ncbi:MAG: hypothetical protein M3N29_06685 [Chloroflexota bacterium]|nr:hypothetical protein [Chloroflexota bacterium]
MRARHRMLMSWRLDCPLCGRECAADRLGEDHPSFVTDVAVDAVREQALELLAEQQA